MKSRLVSLCMTLAALTLTPLAPGAAPAAPAATAAPSMAAGSAPFWTGMPNAARFAKIQSDRLAKARLAIDRLVAVKGPRTIANTLVPYDEVQTLLDAAGSQSGLMEEVHPDSALRAAAEKESQLVSALATEISLNRKVYDALAALDVSQADAETRFYVEHELRDFRLAKDDATRAKIAALRDTLVKIGQEFDRNIRSDVRTIQVASGADLDGLPADFITSHKPGADGKITLDINYPDYVPVMTYAKSEDTRRRLYMEFQNRAYPKNIEVLNRMIAQRHALANLLGYPTWADYITVNKMVENPKNARDFINKIVAASAASASHDYQVLLRRKQKDVPDATVVNFWETSYWSEMVKTPWSKAQWTDLDRARPLRGSSVPLSSLEIMCAASASTAEE